MRKISKLKDLLIDYDHPNDWQYQQWKKSLPDNLRNTDDSYDLYGAFKAGMQPELNEDGSYHLGSRDPKTGRILKRKNHSTYNKAIEADIEAGYYPVEYNGETYTRAPIPMGDSSGWQVENNKRTVSRPIRNNKTQQYTVQKGDSLWRIAKNNNITLDELVQYNDTLTKGINTVIHPGDVLNVEKPIIPIIYNYQKLEDVEKRESLANLDNVSAIQSAKHHNNYVIVDKKYGTLSVFDKNNNLLYKTDQINTGASKNDYNTITYTDEKGQIRDMMGNNSTPAGITVISGIGEYHGYPSFTRSRVDSYGNIKKVNGKNDDVASSFHHGIIVKGKGSNGCVRIGGQQLKDLSNYIRSGTKVYTLPEKEGSRFTIRNGRLSYTADNPYGETKGKRRYWDDYNVSINKSYNPLRIKPKNKIDKEYDDNVNGYIDTLQNSKEFIQKRFNLDSYTYDKLAQLAVGIAQQETKFGTSRRKKLKDSTPDWVLNLLRGNSNRSRGLTQIKLKGDNQEMQKIYKELNITEDNLNDPKKSSLATIARLAHMYNSEVKGRIFKNNSNQKIDHLEALLYKWMGRNVELKNKTATPNKNLYIRNVKRYINDFDFYTGIET